MNMIRTCLLFGSQNVGIPRLSVDNHIDGIENNCGHLRFLPFRQGRRTFLGLGFIASLLLSL